MFVYLSDYNHTYLLPMAAVMILWQNLLVSIVWSINRKLFYPAHFRKSLRRYRVSRIQFTKHTKRKDQRAKNQEEKETLNRNRPIQKFLYKSFQIQLYDRLWRMHAKVTFSESYPCRILFSWVWTELWLASTQQSTAR